MLRWEIAKWKATFVSNALACHLKSKVKQKFSYCTKSNERLNKEDQERFVCLKETWFNKIKQSTIMCTATEPKPLLVIISLWFSLCLDFIKQYRGNISSTTACMTVRHFTGCIWCVTVQTQWEDTKSFSASFLWTITYGSSYCSLIWRFGKWLYKNSFPLCVC